MYGILFFLPQYLQVGEGAGPLIGGLRLLPWTATTFVVAPLAGRFVDRLGERPLIVVGLVLQAIGMAWIGLILAPDLAYGRLILPLVVAGAGVTMAMPAAQSAVLGAVARSELGKASGVFNMFRFLGSVSGVAIAVAVFAVAGGAPSPERFSQGFAVVLGVAATLSLLAAGTGLWAPGRRRPQAATAQVPAE
jgi:MFS family permease